MISLYNRDMIRKEDDHLDRREAGRQNQAVVVTVGHDDAADNAGAHAPGGLVGVPQLVVLIGKGDAVYCYITN